MTKEKNKSLLTLAVLAFCSINMICASTNPIVNKVAKAFPDVAPSTVRLVSTLPSLSAMILAIIVGALIGKKLNYKTVMCAGAACLAIGGCMPAIFNDNIGIILVARFIAGIGMGCAGARNAIVLATFDEKDRTKMLGMAVLCANLGSIVWTQISGWLGDVDWRYSFFVYIAAAAVLVLDLVCYVEPEHIEAKQEAIEEAPEDKLSESGFTARGFSYVFIMLFAAIMVNPLKTGMSTLIANRELGGAAASALILNLYTVGGAVGGYLLSLVTKKFKRYSMPFAFSCVAVGQFCILLSQSAFVIGLGSCLSGFGYFFANPCCAAYVRHAVSKRRVAFMATLIMAAIQSGMFFSTYWFNLAQAVVGKFYSTDVECSFLLAGILFAVMAVVLLVIDPRPKKLQELQAKGEA